MKTLNKIPYTKAFSRLKQKMILSSLNDIFINQKFSFSSKVNKQSKEKIEKGMNYDLEGLIEQLLSNISKDEIRMPTKVDKLFGIRTTSQTSGLDINNYNNVKVIALRREVMENPNFLDKFIDKTPNKSEKQLKEEKNNLKNAILDKLKPSPIRNKGYFASLLNKYSQGYDITNKEEKKLSNVQKFNDAYVLGGPKHMLSKEQINNIHGQIDLAMKELEESGLSKEELLYDIPKGIPLKQDHFFQFVRHNKKAREMLIASTEDFSVSSVIEKALKQSLGPDPSVGAGKRDVNDPEELNDNYLFELENRKADKKYHDNYLHDDSYYYQSNKEFKNHVYMNFLNSKPITFIRPPRSRAEKRRRFQYYNLTTQDLHWTNITVLAKFVNLVGGVVNRSQSRLTRDLHKKMLKSIKHLRHLGIFPHHDRILPTDKLPFTSLHEMFIEDMTKTVDSRTGTLKLRPAKNTNVDASTYGKYESAKAAWEACKKEIKSQEFKKQFETDTSEFPDDPTQEQIEYLLAQNYLMKLEVGNIDLANLSKIEQKEKEYFQKYYKKIIQKMSLANVADGFISEKGYSIQDFLKNSSINTNENKNEVLDNANNKNKNDLGNQLLEIEKLVGKLVEAHGLNNVDDLASEDKIVFRENYDDDIFDRQQKDQFIVSPLKEPTLNEGIKFSRFRYKKFKSEKH